MNLSYGNTYYSGTPFRKCVTTGVTVFLLLVAISPIFSFSDSLAAAGQQQHDQFSRFSTEAGIDGGQNEKSPTLTGISSDQVTPTQSFQSQQLPQGQPNALSYADGQYEITFSYPMEWFAQDMNEDDEGVEYIALFAPYDSIRLEESRFDEDEYDTEVIVGTEGLYEDGQSMGEFFYDMLDSYEKNKDNFVLIESNPNFMVNGMPGYSLVYRNGDYIYKEVGVIMGDRNYWIEYSASPEDYSRHLSGADQIISSFGFGGSNGNQQSNMVDNTGPLPAGIEGGGNQGGSEGSGSGGGDVGFGGTPVSPDEGESSAPMKPKF